MVGRWTALALFLVGAAACIRLGDFACDSDEACSRGVDGMCVDGSCAYADETCDTGHRFGRYAGELAGRCVEPAGSAEGSSTGDVQTTAASTGDSTDDGPIPTSCDGVDCGGGRCVMVDDAPTCACDPGLYPVGLACEVDPCSELGCIHVDPEIGDDGAAGTAEAPLRTLAAAVAAVVPGTAVLLRRGAVWTEDLRIVEVAATLAEPVVFGAWGPPEEPRPTIAGEVFLRGAVAVTLRDLAVDGQGAAEGTLACVRIRESDEIVLLDSELRGCLDRGVKVETGSAHVALVGNTIVDPHKWAGIAIGDGTDTNTVGSHHWIVDNVIVGGDATQADNALAKGIGVHEVEAGDTKIVGNVVSATLNVAIEFGSPTAGWIVGNVVGSAAAGIDTRAVDGQVTGNLVFESGESAWVRGRLAVEANTFLGSGSGAGLRVGNAAQMLTIERLLVGAAAGAWVETDLESEGIAAAIAAMDGNAYLGTGPGICAFRVAGEPVDLDLSGWQMLTSFDLASTCGSVAGLSGLDGIPPAEWPQAAADAFAPDPAWEACDDPPGALGCDGEWRGRTLQPLPGVADNGGLGWEGPLVVRQRYDILP